MPQLCCDPSLTPCPSTLPRPPAVFALLLVLGTAAFLLGALLARRAKDYRQEEHLVLPGGGGTPVAASGEELLQATGGPELGHC